MSNPVLGAISERRSVRAYREQAVTKEQFDILLRAAQESPSARNAQPWHSSVVQNSAIFAEINAEAAKNLNKDVGDIFYGASAAIFLSCEAGNSWGRTDCGIAVQIIVLAAYSVGLGSVILGTSEAAFVGPNGSRLNKLLKFPDGYTYAVAIALGVTAPAGTKKAHFLEPRQVDFVG